MTDNTRRIRSELPNGDPTLLNRLAWARRWSDSAASIDFAKTARSAATKGSGRRSRMQHGLALCTLAWHAKMRGDLDEAMGYCLSAETFLPERENPEPRARVYAILGGVHFARNRFDLANCALDRGFWLLRDMPDEDVPEAMVDLLLTRAIVQRHTGERARAGITLSRAQEIGNAEMLPSVEFCAATWVLADGDAEAARIRGVTALETARSSGNRMSVPYLLSLLGACDIKLGRFDEAQVNLDEATKLAMAGDDDRVQCFIHRHYAQLEMGRGNPLEAKDHLEKAARKAKSLNLAFERKRVVLQLADLLEELKEYKRAVQQHKLAWRLQNETRMN